MTKLNKGAFRVWDSKDNKYVNLDDESFRYTIDKNGDLIAFVAQECFIELSVTAYISVLTNKNIFIVEYFTGFYDCNDQPIFEGDLLKHHRYGVSPVVWSGSQWTLEDSIGLETIKEFLLLAK